MNILKNFKSNKLDDKEIKIECKDHKLYANPSDEVFTQSLFGES